MEKKKKNHLEEKNIPLEKRKFLLKERKIPLEKRSVWIGV